MREDLSPEKWEHYEKQIRIIDPLFEGKNFSYLMYEYCADPVCLKSPDDYDCPYVCDFSQEERIDVSSRYFMNLRRGFLPRKGFTFVSIDYSQIELRLAANLSGEPVWINSFLSGEDLHRNTAKACFKTDDPTDKQRKNAKAFNFGALYGGGAAALAANLNIPLEEAKSGLDNWKNGVPVLQGWFQKVIRESKKMGYAQSYFGRRRYLQNYYNPKDKNLTPEQKRRIINRADRFALNHVVQGCLAYDSRVMTNRGYLKIGELYDKIKFADKVWDGEGWRNFEVLERGEARRVDITTLHGKVLKVDDRHKLFIAEGAHYRDTKEVHIKDLKVYDPLCYIPVYQEIEFEKEFVPFYSKYDKESPDYFEVATPQQMENMWFWLGYSLNQGAVRDSSVIFKFDVLNENESSWKDALSKFSEDFSNLNINYTISGKKINYTVASKGLSELFKKLNPDNDFPEVIFSETLANRKSFLAGIWKSFFTKANKYSVCSDKHFCYSLQSLYETVGVMASFKKGELIYTDEFNTIYANGFSAIPVAEINVKDTYEITYTLSVDHPNHRYIADGFLHKNTAADILKISMLNADKLIRDNKWENDARILLTVHDEIDLEIRDEMLDVIIPALRKKMEIKIGKWPVGLAVDVEVAKDWGSVDKYIPGFYTESKKETLDSPYILVPRRLDEDEVSLLECIIKENPGMIPVQMGYDSHIFNLTVGDVDKFIKKMKDLGFS